MTQRQKLDLKLAYLNSTHQRLSNEVKLVPIEQRELPNLKLVSISSRHSLFSFLPVPYLYSLSIPSLSLELSGAFYQLLRYPPELVCNTNSTRLLIIEDTDRTGLFDLIWSPITIHYDFVGSGLNPTER